MRRCVKRVPKTLQTQRGRQNIVASLAGSGNTSEKVKNLFVCNAVSKKLPYKLLLKLPKRPAFHIFGFGRLLTGSFFSNLLGLSHAPEAQRIPSRNPETERRYPRQVRVATQREVTPRAGYRPKGPRCRETARPAVSRVSRRVRWGAYSPFFRPFRSETCRLKPFRASLRASPAPAR